MDPNAMRPTGQEIGLPQSQRISERSAPRSAPGISPGAKSVAAAGTVVRTPARSWLNALNPKWPCALPMPAHGLLVDATGRGNLLQLESAKEMKFDQLALQRINPGQRFQRKQLRR